MSEPIKDGRETNETEEGLGKFVVAGGYATVAFDPAEKAFDLMSAPVVTPIEAGCLPTTALGRDAATGALGAEAGPEDIGIESLISNDPATAHTGRHGPNGMLVMLRAGCEAERRRASAPINDCQEFGVQSTLGATNRLGRLSTLRIGAMLMEFDVRAIQVPQLALSVLRQDREHPDEQAAGAPATVACIAGRPRSVTHGQIPPRQAGAQDEEDGAEHKSFVLRRSPPSSPASGTFWNSRVSTAIRSIY